MSPKNRLMESGGPEHRPRVDAIVEKDHQGRPPAVSDRKRLLPPPWLRQLVRGKVEGVQVRLRQIVSAGHISLRLGFGKPWELLQIILLPSPGHDCPEILASLVRGPSGIGTSVVTCSFMDPVEEFTNVVSLNLIDVDSFAPGTPLRDGRPVLFCCSSGFFVGVHGLRPLGWEFRMCSGHGRSCACPCRTMFITWAVADGRIPSGPTAQAFA